MSNMINFLLENAKQTVISARIILDAMNIKDSDNSYHNWLSDNSNTAADMAAELTPGFSTGTDLPSAWE